MRALLKNPVYARCLLQADTSTEAKGHSNNINFLLSLPPSLSLPLSPSPSLSPLLTRSLTHSLSVLLALSHGCFFLIIGSTFASAFKRVSSLSASTFEANRSQLLTTAL